MTTTGDQQLVKRINRSVLLRLVRGQPGLSRAQLATHSGLTKSTVGLLVRELVEEGWLAESSTVAAAGMGRPSTPLQMDGATRGLIGVEVGVDCFRAVGVSLVGQVLCALEEPLRSKQPASVCTQLAGLVAAIHKDLSARGMQASGIGIGLPGVFDERSGLVWFAPNLGWRQVNILPQISAALRTARVPELPLHLQNEADTGALSEYEFATDENQDSLIFVACDIGVGAGIVLNDRLFTGVQGMAGEIGHSILQIDGPLCTCGRYGCAETFIGAGALAREMADTGGVERAGRYLGVLLQNLWTTFNPSLLVLGGASCVYHPELVRIATDTLSTHVQRAGMAAPQVRAARYGLLASAVGAAALVLHHYLRPMHPRGAPGVAQQASEVFDAPHHAMA